MAIARAIAKRPQVLLCDEPTGALDLRTSLSVLDTIEQANRQLGTLTVIITHNTILGEMADRVIRLSNGRISNSRAKLYPAVGVFVGMVISNPRQLIHRHDGLS